MAAGLVAVVLGAGAVGAPAAAGAPAGPAPVEQRSASTVTADALPTVQIDDGVVWSQAIVGNTVFAGGSFSQTRPPGAAKGTQLTPRSNLLAYDIRTGGLLPFAPQINGQVKVVRSSPDGKRLYVGGSFSQVDGKARWNLAAFDIATGTLVDDFRPAIGGSYVNAISVTESNVYIGGLFTQAAGVKRTNLAGFTLTGALTAWAPTTDLQVDSMVVAPTNDKLIIGGRFGTVNGATQVGMAALDLTTGNRLTWNVVDVVRNGNTASAGIWYLSTDGTNVYGAAWSSKVGFMTLEGTFAAEPTRGDLVWIGNGRGDNYAAFSDGKTLYSVGHAHDLEPMGGFPEYNTPSGKYQFSLAMTVAPKGASLSGGSGHHTGRPTPALIHWYPTWVSGKFTGMGQAGWTVEGNGDYIAVGGEFQGVNGAAQNGLVRFAKPGIAPSKAGPLLAPEVADATARWEKPTFVAAAGGGQVTIRPNYDRDDRTLTYELYRSGTTTPVARTTLTSDHWTRTSQSVVLRDTTAAPSTTYTYQVKAIDPDGNSMLSAPVTGTTPGPVASPNAAFTQTVQDQTVNLDARTSTAPAGRTITAYAWDFGDGTTGTGATTSHTYAAAGTYTVKLTVTDSLGATGSTTATVTATAPAPVGPFAVDTFERTTADWGSADVGGAWTADRGLTVGGGVGMAPLPAPGQTRSAWLSQTAVRDVDLTVDVGFDKAPAGGPSMVSTAVRHTDAGDYRVKAAFNANGTVTINLMRALGGTETVMKNTLVPGYTYTAGQMLRLRFVAQTVDATTTVHVKAWPAGTTEPAAWLLTGTDTEPALQAPGQIGIVSYLSSGATNAPQTLRVDNLTAIVP